MADQDGGPAFPESGPRGQAIGGEGMSLRDWFAGRALAGLLSNPSLVHTGSGPAGPPHFAAAVYELADALLAERDKRDG